MIALFKTEVIRRRGPWRGFDDVEYATLEWVAWFNQQRLLEPLGYLPPAEYEERFYGAQATQPVAAALDCASLLQTRGDSERAVTTGTSQDESGNGVVCDERSGSLPGIEGTGPLATMDDAPYPIEASQPSPWRVHPSTRREQQRGDRNAVTPLLTLHRESQRMRTGCCGALRVLSAR